MQNQPIVVERVFEAHISKVWKAITNKHEMKKWYFDLADFVPGVGFKFQFTGGPSPYKQYLHLCEITEAIPEKTLTYSWRYDSYEGISFVTFELHNLENQTLLKLTHTGIDSFPKENPDFAIDNFIEGWNHIVHTSLKEYIEA